jgi:hypothetical protein
MGVIAQVLGLIVSYVLAMEALRRFGIDLGWLNPLTFFRRRSWRNKVTTPPLYTLQHPVDVVAVLALATVQTTGAISTQQKAGVQQLLRDKLSLSEADATNLWLASSHLLRNRALELSEVPVVLKPSAEKFTAYHIETLQATMREAALIEPPINAAQQQLIDAVGAFFTQTKTSPRSWSS